MCYLLKARHNHPRMKQMPPIGANLPYDLSPVIATVYNDPENNMIPDVNNNPALLKWVLFG